MDRKNQKEASNKGCSLGESKMNASVKQNSCSSQQVKIPGCSSQKESKTPTCGQANSNTACVNNKNANIVRLILWPLGVLLLILASHFLDKANILSPYLGAALAIGAVILGGWWRFFEGIKNLLQRQITVNVFVTISLTATMLVGNFLAAAIVILIMTVAEAVERYTLDKSRSGIQKLLNLAPKTAAVIRNGEEITIPVQDVQIGEAIVVRPGERIPVDGIVISGNAGINQSAITGESMPVMKSIGDELFAGTLNETGKLNFKATKIGEDTTLAKIVHRVEEAHELKAPIQKIADKFTVWFLPIVLVAAIIAYFITNDINASVSILLVAAPCALVIGTPTAITAGIANMSRRGVLIKGGLYFEAGGKIDALLIDKTGTFTLGKPKVHEIVAFGNNKQQEVLRLAAVGEKESEHPLGKAIVNAALLRNIIVDTPDEFTNKVGLGIIAFTQGKRIVLGRPLFIIESGIKITDEVQHAIDDQAKLGYSTIIVASNDEIIGIIGIADEIRPESKHAIAVLNAVLGSNKIHMLTGDNEASANAIAKQIGITNVHANLLPEDKQDYVVKLQKQGLKVAMVGDGINDAPALASADVGIAMGSGGTDVAVETADVVLMNDDLTRIAEFVEISRSVIKRIKINIFFAVIFNLFGIILGNLGLLTPVIAILLQEAGTVLVILSSTLLLWVNPKISHKLKKNNTIERIDGNVNLKSAA